MDKIRIEASSIRGFETVFLVKTLLVFVLGIGWPGFAQGNNISLGIVTSEHTGISLQKRADQQIPAWHVSTYFQSKDFLQFNGDVQYFLKPGSMSFGPFQGMIYSGLGIRVVSIAHKSQEEQYWLRLPLGVQIESQTMHLQVFFEFAGLAGPLPTTTMDFSPVLGARILL